MLIALPETDGSPLWSVHPEGPSRRPVAGLSFATRRRAAVTIGGLRYAIDASGLDGNGVAYAALQESADQSTVGSALMTALVRRRGRSGEVSWGRQRLTLSRRWRWRLPLPSPEWVWRSAAGSIDPELIRVGRPHGLRTRAVTAVRSDEPAPVPAESMLLVLTLMWIYLDHSGGRPAGGADVADGLLAM